MHVPTEAYDADFKSIRKKKWQEREVCRSHSKKIWLEKVGVIRKYNN